MFTRAIQSQLIAAATWKRSLIVCAGRVRDFSRPVETHESPRHKFSSERKFPPVSSATRSMLGVELITQISAGFIRRSVHRSLRLVRIIVGLLISNSKRLPSKERRIPPWNLHVRHFRRGSRSRLSLVKFLRQWIFYKNFENAKRQGVSWISRTWKTLQGKKPLGGNEANQRYSITLLQTPDKLEPCRM